MLPYLDRVEAPWLCRLTLDVGVPVPLHYTTSGRLFLAFMSDAHHAAMLRLLDLRAITEHSSSHVDVLRHTGNIAQQRRHAFD